MSQVLVVQEQGIAGPRGEDGTPGATGATGATGPQGPPGLAGDAAVAFVHNQGAPSAEWVIDHGLGYVPSIRVIDSGGTEVEGDMTSFTNTSMTMTFTGAFAGVAYLS